MSTRARQTRLNFGTPGGTQTTQNTLANNAPLFKKTVVNIPSDDEDIEEDEDDDFVPLASQRVTRSRR